MASEKFLTNLKDGKNLELLTSAKEWFATQGFDIVRYKYCIDNPVRNKSSLEDDDLNHCEICDTKLYKIDESSRYNRFSEIRVAHKKHLLFIDSCGNEHMTCYGFNRCLDRVGFNGSDSEPGGPFEFKPPTLSDFVSPEINLGEIDKDRRQSVKYEYRRVVVAFLEKWVHLDINKKNVLSFMSDFKFVMTKFVDLYCEDSALFRRKILKIIGVATDEE